MPLRPDRRLVGVVLFGALALWACTAPAPTPSPAASPAAKPAASPSPSPIAAATSPTPRPAPPVGGGGAQLRPAVTAQPVGGNAIIIVPTPNFASNPTSVPAQLAPAVQLQQVSSANIPQVSGTLTRLPTAVPGPPGVSNSSISAAAATGGGGGGIPVIAPVLTATAIPRPFTQVNVQFPAR